MHKKIFNINWCYECFNLFLNELFIQIICNILDNSRIYDLPNTETIFFDYLLHQLQEMHFA